MPLEIDERLFNALLAHVCANILMTRYELKKYVYRPSIDLDTVMPQSAKYESRCVF